MSLIVYLFKWNSPEGIFNALLQMSNQTGKFVPDGNRKPPSLNRKWDVPKLNNGLTLIWRFIVIVKRIMKYITSIGQNTGTFNAWKNVQKNAITTALNALYLQWEWNNKIRIIGNNLCKCWKSFLLQCCDVILVLKKGELLKTVLGHDRMSLLNY